MTEKQKYLKIIEEIIEDIKTSIDGTDHYWGLKKHLEENIIGWKKGIKELSK